jgi:adenylate kinase family enzyme
MSDYDFKPLNDKEFEILCADLLSEVEGHRFERFKPGKDAGVDGRYFTAEKNEIVLQCKHWSNTPLTQLIRELGNIEKLKLDKLKPHRYLLAISTPLSRADKKTIHRLLAPYVLSESDIYGSEDLNDLLKSKPHIEKRHYKLWLHSASVLNHILNNAIIGRSAFSLEEIVRSSSRYVVTSNHARALKLLENLGIIIITGEPGIGKTTLADHLCLYYVTQGFSYLKIGDDLREAETALEHETKQIIYFDDFLGRNYLEALKGHEGNYITQFIRRITMNKNKRFVLTSRSTILNQGKFLIDNFEHNNVQRTEYELRITSLSDMDKAQILYNHIWHSELGAQYINQLYFNKRYREIISHKNFNPRLISYITDATRLDTCTSENYWEHTKNSLNNPSQVWENPFNAQQDDFGRAIILLVALNGYALKEDILADAYHRLIALPENHHLTGRREFQSNIRLLTGSFLNRVVASHGPSTIDLFNPSIADYVLNRYANDAFSIRVHLQSLRTTRSLVTLRSLEADNRLTTSNTKSICEALIKHVTEINFDNVSISYASKLCDIYIYFEEFNEQPSNILHPTIRFITNKGAGDATDESFDVIQWGVIKNIVSIEDALKFIKRNIDAIESYLEMRAVMSLISILSHTTPEYDDIKNMVKEHIINEISDNFSGFIEIEEAFAKVHYDDDKSAYIELEKLVEKEFSYIGIEFCESDINRALENFDVPYELQSFYENTYEPDDRRSEGPATLAIDQIDDLFDRH